MGWGRQKLWGRSSDLISIIIVTMTSTVYEPAHAIRVLITQATISAILPEHLQFAHCNSFTKNLLETK